MRYFGIDTHKAFVMIAAVDESMTVVQKPLRIEMDDFAGWVAQTLGQQDHVVLEANTNTWHLHDILAQHAGQVQIANTYKTRLIAEARIKTDKVDALVLARLLASNFICEVWVPETQVREARALTVHRSRLARQSTLAKNRIHALLARHDLRPPQVGLFSGLGMEWLKTLTISPLERLELQQLLAQFTLIEGQIHEIEVQLARLAAQDPRIPRLMQIAGIGYFTAFGILAIIGDIQRFSDPDQLTAYAGLVPSTHQSGGKSYHGHITKQGSSLLRCLLVEAAHIAVQFDPHWKKVYEQLQKRRGKGIAIVAVARKLLVVIWHLLHNHSNYYYLQAQSYIRKLQDWAWRIGSAHLTEASSKEFVRRQLKNIGLGELAEHLTSDKKGKLQLLTPA